MTEWAVREQLAIAALDTGNIELADVSPRNPSPLLRLTRSAGANSQGQSAVQGLSAAGDHHGHAV